MKPKKQKIKELCGNCLTELIRIQKGDFLLGVYCPKCKRLKFASSSEAKDLLTQILKEVTL